MGTKDPRVDAYIAKSAEFAKPILVHIRELIHDKKEEYVDWITEAKSDETRKKR